MKILGFTDTHIHTIHRFSKPTRDGLSTRSIEHIAAFRGVADAIRREKPDQVVHLGDLIHTQGSVSSEVLYTTSKCLKTVIEACTEVGAEFRLLVGNHDKLTNEAHVINSIEWLELVPGVRLISKPAVEDGITYIPHTIDYATFPKQAGELGIAFTHLDYPGARFNAHIASKAGPNEEQVSSFKTIINGHIHLPQILNMGNAKVYHPGSLQEWSFKEAKGDIERGIILLDTDSHKVQWIANTWSPRFKTITDPDQIDPKRPQDYYNVQITFSEDIKRFEGLIPGRFEVEPLVTRKSRIPGESLGSFDQVTPQDVVSKYVDGIVTNLDKVSLVETGLAHLA